MSTKPFYAIALAEDGRSASISVRGPIGNWYDGKTIEQFEHNLAGIGAVDEIVVRVTSFGGKLEHGLAMHNALRRHPARVVVIVEGVAASAGSIVAMAGDEIRMYANSAMMVHGVKLLNDDGEEVDNAEAARALNATLIETYAARTGKPADEVQALLDAEKWMTAREAVAAGFADSVIEIAPAAPAAQPTGVLAAFASAMQIPVEVLERAQAEAAQAAAENDPETSEGGDPSAAPSGNAAGADAPGDEGGQGAGQQAGADVQSAAVQGAEAHATFAAQVNALAAAQGMGDYVAAWLLDTSITTVDEAQAAIREACEVRDLCAFANAADRLPEFVRGRKSLADVRAALINAQADAGDRAHTDGYPKSSTSQPSRAGSKPAVSIASIYSTLNSTARH